MRRRNSKTSRRQELGRRLAQRKERSTWHFGPSQSTPSRHSESAENLIHRLRRQVLYSAD